MLQLRIGTIAVDSYTTDFSVNTSAAQSKNSFINWDGTAVEEDAGEEMTLNIRLASVPTVTAQALSNVLSSSSVSVSFTNPAITCNNFKKVAYEAKSRNKGDTWNISMTLKSTAPIGGGGL